MTIEECYRQMGGSYERVIARLSSQKLIEKFIEKFLEDTSFAALSAQINNGNPEEAFRAAHTLKGVCANLSFDRLLDSTARLTDVLRPKTEPIPDTAKYLLEEVQQDYQRTVAAIQQYLHQK